MLVSDGVHDATDTQVIDKLRALHPSEAAVGPSDIRDIPLLIGDDATPDDKRDRLTSILHLVRSFPKESAAGPSGLWPSHLQDCLIDETLPESKELIEALDAFVCWAASGRIPLPAAPFLCAARLTPLRKPAAHAQMVAEQQCFDDIGNCVGPDLAPNGPTLSSQAVLAVRPIAAGEVLRRLVSKFVMRHPMVTKNLADLCPSQVGVGLQGAVDLVP